VIDAILEHARAEAPQEACGLVIEARDRPRVVRCRNVHPEPEEHFRIEPREFAHGQALGKLLAIYHSHPGGRPDPTSADRAACNASGLPWIIVSPERGDWLRVEPNGQETPLLARPYCYGVHDCYALVRDYYARELGLALPDFERPADPLAERDVFGQHAAAAGFVRAADLRQHDVVILAPRGLFPSHCAVYIGDGEILHHHVGRLSSLEEYDEGRRSRTEAIYRHADLA
jgi:proteasome lid subunit RPN8/RPN11